VVVTAAGEPIGVVTDVLHHGQDLLVVRRDGRPGTPGAQGLAGPAAGEALVPFVGAIVTDVDVAAGRLVIDPPAGLLDPDEAIEA
jgi:16S rRNA processing protein RimM